MNKVFQQEDVMDWTLVKVEYKDRQNEYRLLTLENGGCHNWRLSSDILNIIKGDDFYAFYESEGVWKRARNEDCVGDLPAPYVESYSQKLNSAGGKAYIVNAEQIYQKWREAFLLN